MENAEDGSDRGRGDSNETTGDNSFRLGGLEARGKKKSTLMKHRFGRQTTASSKGGKYRTDDDLDKPKPGGGLKEAEQQINGAGGTDGLPSLDHWIIGVGSGGDAGEAGEIVDEEAGAGGRGWAADIDAHDPFANVQWGVSLEALYILRYFFCTLRGVFSSRLLPAGRANGGFMGRIEV